MAVMTITQFMTGIKTWVLGKIDNITSLIPSQASSSNKLADKDFVNSSIATATATFQGTYNVVSDLSLSYNATHAQIQTALATKMSALSITPDNNDYVFVQIPASDATPTQIEKIEKYKYNGSAWAFEYELNNSSFTAEQWAAINSGATLELIGKLSDLPTNTELTTLLAGKVDKVNGKGLSTNDYTTNEKSKLSELPTNANLNIALGAKADVVDFEQLVGRVGLLSVLINTLSSIVSQIEENGFCITDSNGKIAMKYDANGLDAALLSTHLQNLIKQIDGIGLSIGTTTGTAYDGGLGAALETNLQQLQGVTNQAINRIAILNIITNTLSTIVSQITENGFCVTDPNGKIGMKYDTNGFDVAKLSEHLEGLIKQIDGLGLSIGTTTGTAYDGGLGASLATNLQQLESVTNQAVGRIEILNIIINTLSAIVTRITENGFCVTDTNGKIGMKYDANGFDVALLSTHLEGLIKQIDGIGLSIGTTTGTAYDGGLGSTLAAKVQRLENQSLTVSNILMTAEEGLFVVDENGKIGMKYTQNGFDVADITTHLLSLIDNNLESKQELEEFKTLVNDGLLKIYHERNAKLVLPSSAKVLLYGDSISSEDYTWYKEWMQEYTGLNNVYNGGFSGFTAAQIAANSSLQRIFNYEPDVIILQTGGNDIGATVGTFGAIPDEDTVNETDITADYNGTYFIQAVSHMIRKITSYYYDVVTRANLTGQETAEEKINKIANVKLPYFAVITPLPQKRSGGNLTWSFEPNWIRKRNAVVECCNKYNVHCIDVYSLWGVDMSKEPEWSSPTDKVNQRGIYTMDGLHPSKVGYRKIVQLINGQIDIVVEN